MNTGLIHRLIQSQASSSGILKTLTEDPSLNPRRTKIRVNNRWRENPAGGGGDFNRGVVQCSRCKTWRLINPFRCTGENNAAGAKDAAIWSREGIKTGEVKAQSRKQFQSAGGSLRDQVNVGRERSKTKKEL